MHDADCVPVQKRLKDCTAETLQRENAVWHRTCYSMMTNTVQRERARDRQQHSMSTGSHTPKVKGRRSRSADDVNNVTGSAAPYTRSSTRPLNKDMCFFCQTDNGQKLFSVRTMNAGQSLKQAVQASSDPQMKTRYSTCIADSDAHAMDVQYHKACWTKHVFHVLRDDTNQAPKTKQSPTQVSSFVELLNIIDTQTRDGAYLSIQDIENTYVSMLHVGGTEALKNHSPAFTRQWLKDRILSELPHVKSVRPRNMRSPAVLYCPEACDADMVQTAIRTADDTDSMKNLYQSARLLRQRIEQFTKTVKTPSSIVVTSTLEDVPVELYTMIRWIMAGPADKLQTEVRTTIVDRGALTLSQNLMFGFKSKRQVTYKPSDEGAGFRSQQAMENPQVLGLATRRIQSRFVTRS